MSTDNSQYIIQNDTGVCVLDCQMAFNGLTEKERLYAHYISQASWFGGLIVLVQVRLIPNIIHVKNVLDRLITDNVSNINGFAQLQKIRIV